MFLEDGQRVTVEGSDGSMGLADIAADHDADASLSA